MIWCQVSGSSNMLAALANVLGMAITVGVRARLGCRSGMRRSASASTEALRTQALDSGTQTSGVGPNVLVSHSPASVLATLAESPWVMVTETQMSWIDGAVSDQFRFSFCMIGSIRGLTTTVAVACPVQPALIR